MVSQGLLFFCIVQQITKLQQCLIINNYLLVLYSSMACQTKLGLTKVMKIFQVAQYMLEHRSTDRQSVLVGPSVHNQRIECQWRDMRNVSLYYIIGRI